MPAVAMWSPSSEDSLLARKTIASAFHRLSDAVVDAIGYRRAVRSDMGRRVEITSWSYSHTS
jgi:hypothetical protein